MRDLPKVLKVFCILMCWPRFTELYTKKRVNFSMYNLISLTAEKHSFTINTHLKNIKSDPPKT